MDKDGNVLIGGFISSGFYDTKSLAAWEEVEKLTPEELETSRRHLLKDVELFLEGGAAAVRGGG